MKTAPVLSNVQFQLFQDYLVKECGIVFKRDTSQTLLLALAARMDALNVASVDEYFTRINNNQPQAALETRKFIELLTIPETYFFSQQSPFSSFG